MTQTGKNLTAGVARVQGHFGEWIQGKLGASGQIALVSIRCSDLWVEVSVQPATEPSYTSQIDCLPPETIGHWFRSHEIASTGEIAARTNMIAGAGMGASTASLLALAQATGLATSDPKRDAQQMLQHEGATDPLMYPDFDRFLWASRQGEILERFQPPPRFEVLGGTWGQPCRTNAGDTAFPQIDDLVLAWRDATAKQDHHAVADIATESAKRTSAQRDGGGDPSFDVAKELGALGVIRAHTGSARGFLFAPNTAPDAGLQQLAEAGYSALIRFETGEGQ